MTTLVAICSESPSGYTTYFGADDQITSGSTRSEVGFQKWVLSSKATHGIAFAGRPTISCYFSAGKYVEDFEKAVNPLLAADFLARVAEENKWTHQHSEVGARDFQMEGLYFCKKGLFEIDTDFTFMRVDQGVPSALGSGGKFALGAMYALRQQAGVIEASPRGYKKLLTAGLKAASQFDIYTSGSFVLGTSGRGFQKD